MGLLQEEDALRIKAFSEGLAEMPVWLILRGAAGME
jgi:hypothetical protein